VSRHLEEHVDLCASYALGCLDAPDRERLEAHLAGGCAACEVALREFGDAVTSLAASAPPVAPPPALRERVLAAARSETVRPAPAGVTAIESRRSITPWLGWIAAAASLAFALWSQRTATQLRSGLEQQRTRVVALEQERAALEERLAESRRWVGIAAATNTHVAQLQPTPDGDPSLHGRAFLDATTQRAAFAFDNLTPPAGRDYQLWSIRGGKPESLGVLHADPGGDAFVELDVGDPAALQGFAVSLEPAGGSPTPNSPSGPVVMLAQLTASP
jgi:anti-sigma-K factor RskA